MAERTSPGINCLLRPIVEESRIFSMAPTQINHPGSSRWHLGNAFPYRQSPVFFSNHIYANADFVPAPSACITLQKSGSSCPEYRGRFLQKALGNNPLSIFLMALAHPLWMQKLPAYVSLVGIHNWRKNSNFPFIPCTFPCTPKTLP